MDNNLTSSIRLILAIRQTSDSPKLVAGFTSYITSLDTPSGHTGPSLRPTIQRLMSLLADERDADNAGRLPWIENDFISFLADSSGYSPFSGATEAHEKLALRCLTILADELRFDICQFPSSFLRNKDVRGLRSQADLSIPSHLRYAARYWTHHVSHLKEIKAELTDGVAIFFQNHFLYWLEVMSILELSPFEALKHLSSAPVCHSLPVYENSCVLIPAR